MNSIDYIGFDIHKKTISFCAKAQDGRILDCNASQSAPLMLSSYLPAGFSDSPPFFKACAQSTQAGLG
jgi:hypothetical protein